MNDELKDGRVRGKKMLTGKRLIFAVFGAILAGAVIAGLFYYETSYKYRQYSVDLDSDLGKAAAKIAQNTMVGEGYKSNNFIPRYIKAQNVGNDVVRLWVSLSESDVYRNSTLLTNHPIKDGEASILQYQFVQSKDNERIPWKPNTAQWPARYYAITVQNSVIEASLNGVPIARMIDPAIVEMSEEENRKQIDSINELIYKFGGNNLTYDANILVISAYGVNNPWPRKAVEVVIDISGNNAKTAGIIKQEYFNVLEDGYYVRKTVEESKWYKEPEFTVILQYGN